MASVMMQRDLVVILKKETLLNVKILSKVCPMKAELSSQMLKENALEKLTQNVFNHLAYYLVNIIDSQASAALPWPLYDSKTERSYRNELAVLISDYSNKGLLSPVMSSYLVNPGCYKVTFLLFQLTQLAVQRILTQKMDKEYQKTLYDEMTEKYKSQNTNDFIDCIEKTTEVMLSKFSNYLCKRRAMEKNAEVIKNKIISMEDRLKSVKAQEFIDKLVDDFIKQKHLVGKSKNEFSKIKDVNEQPEFFERWLSYVDKEIDDLESKWQSRTAPFLKLCRETMENSEALIARQTGETDQRSFILEYNDKTDAICTTDLESEVNCEQKYILKNIVKDNRLNFPNLIRGFLVSISYVLRNTEIGDEIYKFNECFDGGRQSYTELVSSMTVLVERVLNAESQLQYTPVQYSKSMSVQEFTEIPPIPDLSDLKMGRNYSSQSFCDAFTPWNLRKHQFNLRSKSQTSFTKPKIFVTPFHLPPKMDMASSRTSAYDQANTTANIMNLSVISTATSRGNDTIADFSMKQQSGFTKQQIFRLLSTKKSSSSKKYKFKMERPQMRIKKGGLFNESTSSNESMALIRSHSSPNLYENRDARSIYRHRLRKLSIMKEDTASLLEVSGITALGKDSNHSTPQGVVTSDSCRKLVDSTRISIQDNSEPNSVIMNSIEIDLNKEIVDVSVMSQRVEPVLSESTEKGINESADRKETLQSNTCEKVETPKMNAPLPKQSSSLEKIINRFKKVRASVFPEDEQKECKTIVEEKENMNSFNIDFTANKILLPDLLSPNCNVLNVNTKYSTYLEDFDSDEERPRKPRESLGTALGVDNTFLDQYDVID